MISKVQRFVSASLGVLCALPMLWPSSADAASVNCTLSAIGGGGLPAFFQETYSAQCDGEGLSATGQARATADRSQLQARLRFASGGGSPIATAFGYNANAQFIPGCVASDTTSGTSFVTTTCGVAGEIRALILVVGVN